MKYLEPCSSCQRHVRAGSATCPFCSAELAQMSSIGRAPSGRRLGRYAAFTFHSGLLATALGCGESELVTGTGGQTGSGGTTASGGAPASGGAEASGGTASGSGGTFIEVGGLGGMGGDDDIGVPIYSAVPWTGPGKR